MKLHRSIPPLAAWLACALTGYSTLVDFETRPGGATPPDNSELRNPYSFTNGTVQFFFDQNGNNTFDLNVDTYPVFEMVGGADSEDGFVNHPLGHSDTASPGYESRLGGFFLRQPTSFSAALPPFIIKYSTTGSIREMSGEIWDIDGNVVVDPDLTEQWKVEVLNSTGNVVSTQVSPVGTALDGAYNGAPWLFRFTSLPENAEALRITFIGGKTTGGVGLAFDNFSPDIAEAPEPGSLTLAVCGATTILAGRRRRPIRLLSPQT